MKVDDNKAFVSIDGKEFYLLYAPRHKKTFQALQLEIKNSGKSLQKLIVYPQLTNLLNMKPRRVNFQLVGFIPPASNCGEFELDNLEFRLNGLWQFIEGCKVPCISIFKNFTEARKNYIFKEATPEGRANFLKPIHIPVIWQDTPQPPIKLNPRLKKQRLPCFVQIKAKFSVEKELFVFESLMAPPTDKPPRFLKDRDQEKLKKSANIPESRSRNIPATNNIIQQKENSIMPTPGKLEITIKLNELPSDVRTLENNWKEFDLDCEGQLVRVKVKPKVYHKLEQAQANYPQWVAAIAKRVKRSADRREDG